MTTTLSAIGLPPREAIAYLRGKTNVTTDHWTDVWRDGHVRSFMVAGAATDALVADFRTAVADALEKGTTLRDFRAEFDTIVARHGWVHNGSAGWRARIIYETNLSMAYSAGRYAQMTEPDTLAVYPFWQYVHSGSKHPRPQHLAWNGLTLRADDGFWQTHWPPNGWGCGCWVRPVSARGLARQGKSGPDTAPQVETRDWANPRTGQVHRVPVGIDPGFDYNPGAAWQGPPAVPGNAVTRPPPADWPPAPPGGWPPPAAPPPPSPVSSPAAPPLRPGPAPGAVAPTAPPMAAPSPSAPDTAALPGQSVRPRRFRDVPEADAVLTAGSRAWAARLSPEEAAALANYKGGMGRHLNEVLRGARPTDPISRSLLAALHNALMDSRLPEAVRVWRGASAAEMATLRAAGVGGVARLPGLVSTTIDPTVARAYAGDGIVELLLPRRLRGAAYVHPFPVWRYPQFELLIAAGALYKVLAIGAERIVVEVERDDG